MEITQNLKRLTKRIFHGLGFEITRVRPRLDESRQAESELWREVAPFTMTSKEAISVLADAVRYVVSNDVSGAIVECGVWRGGSMMAVARTLIDLGKTDVDLYLFDTFDGMTEPTEKDIEWTGRTAAELFARELPTDDSTLLARASLDQVQRAMRSVPYPTSRIHFVMGRVEDTIPDQMPDEIAILRLDTDWYESTKHELVHGYSRLAPRGVLIIDDYSWWQGAGEATDEYFRANGPPPLLVRIDGGGGEVVGVKTHGGPTR